MRQIFLDTETTGLDPRQGHRIIEIACLEMVDRRLTGRHLHKYINPEREIDEGAAAVHGITLEFLADKPKFADVIDEFLEFINGAQLIIHNAPFDLGFLNAAVSRTGHKRNPFHPFSCFDTATLGGLAYGQTVLSRAVQAAGYQWDADEAHSAVYDAERTAALFCTIANRWRRLEQLEQERVGVA